MILFSITYKEKIMEKNTVLLDVDRYNELRDFKENIMKGKCYIIGVYGSSYVNNYNNNNYGTSYFFKDEKDVVADFEEQIIQLNKKIDELNNIISNKNVTQKVEFSKTELKKMSYWKFRKIKKQL